MHPRLLLPILAVVLASACGKSEAPSSEPAAPSEPPPASAPAAKIAPPDPDTETCARVIVVAWQGADYADASLTRSKAEAEAKAKDLHDKIVAGQPFDGFVAESDAKSSRERDGYLGTYTFAEFPAPYLPIREHMFGVDVGGVRGPVEAPFGYVVAQRCPVEKAHVRHVLLRYAGAKNAGPDIKRNAKAAKKEAEKVLAKAKAGEDFEALARTHSEDASAERGGDLGKVGRGKLAAPVEKATFALAPGAISDVVESEFGFHVLQRVE